ncbi:glucokinase [Pantoea eucrina]|jgi:predicted NBD/HSP70 family sugar kinase|uniref:ATP-binding protein n=1 Tax=Pantoea eucrina TaxID=472693 RepID=A0ABU5LFG6_9GAMM|nr:glucokinase [Pantoea eucrina]MDZ7278451.1 ATP-binding protein [Pantoea eucrina]
MTMPCKQKTVVLVNGIPASGKSTLTRALAQQFGFPVLTLDSLKEPFMRYFAPVDRQRNRQLGCAAYQAIWNVVGQAPAECTWLIDAWFGFQPVSVLQEGLEQAGVTRVLELWLAISPDDAVARYQARLTQRLPGHPGAEYLPELHKLAETARPMALGPVLSLAANALDVEAASRWLHRQLQASTAAPPRLSRSG